MFCVFILINYRYNDFFNDFCWIRIRTGIILYGSGSRFQPNYPDPGKFYGSGSATLLNTSENDFRFFVQKAMNMSLVTFKKPPSVDL